MGTKFEKNCAILAKWFADRCTEELQIMGTHGWRRVQPRDHLLLTDEIELRIKPRTILINGIEVPEPVREPLTNKQEFFLVDTSSLTKVSTYYWMDSKCDKAWLKAGLIHLTPEAALIHANALIATSKIGDKQDE